MINKKIKLNGFYLVEKDGEKHILPSVTTILEAMPKPQLIYWAAKLSARAVLQGEAETEEQATSAITIAKSEGAKRGSLVHSLTEAADNGASPDINSLPPDIRPYALAHQKFVNDFKPKLIYNEQTAVNLTFGYGGTIDRVYEIDGKMVIVDYKTSANYYPSMGLQLAAYRNAEFTITPDGKYEPMPKIDQTMVVLLGDDGGYTVKDTNESLEIFLALKKIWLWINKEKMEKVKVAKK